MKSMTGYGRSKIESAQFVQQWEIHSVNGKRLDLKWALPSVARPLEGRFEKLIRLHSARGRVDVTLSLQSADGCMQAHFDLPQAKAMLRSLDKLACERGDVYRPDYNALLSVQTLWTGNAEEASEELAEELERGLSLALDDWDRSRATEGEALCKDLAARVLQMEQWTASILERAPQIKEERAEALRARVAERLEAYKIAEIEESRFLQEIVMLADRLDVTEELTRLDTHLKRLRELLGEDSDTGRRLDFTLQECFREINTCGNKIQDARLSKIVVDYKNELEKCREQAQNLE